MRPLALILLLCVFLCNATQFSAYADTPDNSSSKNFYLRETVLNSLANQSQTHFYFRQEKKMAVLSKPLITKGELILQSNNTITWDIQKPYAIRYELSRDLIKEIDANGERTILPGRNPLAAALTEAMVAAFSGHWENKEDFASVSASGLITNWKLDIIPRSVDLQKVIQRITVDGSGNTIHQINIMENNNDSTSIQLTAF